MKWIDRDGHMFAPPLVVDGVEHHSPSSELLLRAGYHPYTPERRPTKRVLKFDRYKVILALGEAWTEKRAELEATGQLDLFMASPYLSLGDPLFRAVWKTLSVEQKYTLITKCKYEK